MNEEEKKAIKVLKVNPRIVAELDDDLLYKMLEFEGQSIDELKNWSYRIVLNLIKKQQAEIEIHTELEHQYKKEYLDIKEVAEKKDKIIDEVIGYITTRNWSVCPNENEDCGDDLDCENRCSNDDNIYEECWKMYFERKIESEDK